VLLLGWRLGGTRRWKEGESERETEIINYTFLSKLIKANNEKRLPDHSWTFREWNFARRHFPFLNGITNLQYQVGKY
jgi:hypothetical protein